MANMNVNQRMQHGRVDLTVPTTGVHVRRRRGLIVFMVLALAILGALGYAAVEALDSWARGVVLGVIVLTAVGAMIALDPRRRGW